MADKKISELTAIDAIQPTDLIVVVDDPSGTPVTKKATVSQLPAAGGFDPTASYTMTLGTFTWQSSGQPGWPALSFLSPSGALLGNFRFPDYGESLQLRVVLGFIDIGNSIRLWAHVGPAGAAIYMGTTTGLWFVPDSVLPSTPIPDAGLKRGGAPGLLQSMDLSGKGGGIRLGDTAVNNPKPTASAAVRGALWATWGTTGVADTFEVCQKKADDSYAWLPAVLGTDPTVSTLRLGTNPATVGTIRLPTSFGVYRRDQFNTADLPLLVNQGNDVNDLLVGSGLAPTTIYSNLATPTGPYNGGWWVECVGTSPTRVAAVKVNDGGTIRTIASVTY